MKILKVFILCSFFISLNSIVEGQDKLIYKGDTIYMSNNPLVKLSCFDTLVPILFGSKERTMEVDCIDDARGYSTEWTIINDELYLTGIYDQFLIRKYSANLKSLFGINCIDGKVKADWFSGFVYSSFGKKLYEKDFTCIIIDYIVSEYERRFDFQRGRLNAMTILDNTRTYVSKYGYGKHASSDECSRELKEFISSSINWSVLPKTIKKDMYVCLKISANEKGVIDFTEIDNGERVLKKYPKVFDREAIRIVKSIPKWDIIYLHGVHKRDTFWVWVDFYEEFLKRNTLKKHTVN